MRYKIYNLNLFTGNIYDSKVERATRKEAIDYCRICNMSEGYERVNNVYSFYFDSYEKEPTAENLICAAKGVLSVYMNQLLMEKSTLNAANIILNRKGEVA
nr:MAG TPA: hypothetical protein [Caudoviricetes sp.]DAS32674.1 MAG TPA: hypothetical protein [Caudoviricetes sp.]